MHVFRYFMEKLVSNFASNFCLLLRRGYLRPKGGFQFFKIFVFASLEFMNFSTMIPQRYGARICTNMKTNLENRSTNVVCSCERALKL